MSTRKHFIQAAKNISLIKNIGMRTLAASEAIKLFTAENPRFDKTRFLEACGL